MQLNQKKKMPWKHPQHLLTYFMHIPLRIDQTTLFRELQLFLDQEQSVQSSQTSYQEQF